MNFAAPVSALDALSVSMMTTANNIANMNTDGYKAEIVGLQEAPDNRGVQVSAIYRDLSPGPAVINHMSGNDVRNAMEVSARGMRNSQENYDTAQAQDVWRTQQADTSAAWHVQGIREGQDAESRIRGMAEGSNTDLPREFAQLAVTETAYSANVATIRAMDELTGSLLNVKV